MVEKFHNHFKEVDPILFAALLQIGKLEDVTYRQGTDYFVALCSEIISQQLSGKVADVIFDRFKKLFTKGVVSSRHLLRIPHDAIRATGMSNAKARYIKDLAEKVERKQINLQQLATMEDEDVIIELTKIKGIGRWTAEMFLMFSLGREDVFSHGDLGLKNAMVKLYNLANPTQEQIEQITVKWSPYRTYACRILWKSLEVR